MATFPGGVYSPRTKANKSGVIYTPAKETIGYAEDVSLLDAEVVAIETQLGLGPKWDSANVKERLKGIKSLSDAIQNTLIIKDGNVGIGTINPGAKLDIEASDPSLFIRNSDAADVANINKIDFKMKTITQERVFFRFQGTSVDITDATRTSLIEFQGSDNGSFGSKMAIRGGNVGIGVVDPHSKLEVAGAISSATSIFAAVGPTDDIDVSGVNTLFINSAGNNVTIGGFAGGVDGQVIRVVRISALNDVTIEHNEGGATQPILLHRGADETIDAHFGGWEFVCHEGVDWHDVSHAKYV